ncbi:dipicolinate synthase subunit B [Anaerocolumna cellulosilytica]|uniref:Dipicolinate synthase subunit B n=1 Tax=Anaerocolumna cellulosilytica TaxID=433286 RepID=A0A6S6QV88_9FIRM|nr:dipicolinate synthase subunit B [Anaerocolumna cellulosilytica]MBB5197957.1 dipicolinate synthase subunit B [Anaerocolumna cellulosilytica]BCJ95163.1 dipicolinate synthase subunit B [Anaerocolumna cellulosilytica]
MSLHNKNIGIALTGSFCTFDKAFEEIEKLLADNANVYPILSFNSQKIDSRFGKAADFYTRLKDMTGHEPITTIEDAEPIGPKNMFDILAVIPCTGNTLAKMANGITDTPVLMAAKAHIRNNKPLVLSIATNDALGLNLQNIGTLLNSKNIYFVPFGQDSPDGKPKSMIAHTHLLGLTLESALEGKQIQPVVLSPF